MLTATATFIAKPIKAGNRRQAVAGPEAGRQTQTLTARTMLVSVAQIVRRVINSREVLAATEAVVEADLLVVDGGRFAL
jgi:hypothetical protein